MLHTCSFTSVTPSVLRLILTHPLIFNPVVTTSGMIFQRMSQTLPLELHLSHYIIVTYPSINYKSLKLFLLCFYSCFTAQYQTYIKRSISAYIINKWFPSSLLCQIPNTRPVHSSVFSSNTLIFRIRVLLKFRKPLN